MNGSLKKTGIQDPIGGWERQELVVDNFSTSDSGVAALSPVGSSGTDTTPTSPNIFDLAVNRYGFDYPVFDEDNGGEVNVDFSENDDDSNVENDDEEMQQICHP